MTVTAQVPQNQYTANGATDTFAFTFRILADEDLLVLLDGVRQTKDVDYTVENVTQVGGDVVFTSTPTNNQIVGISRETPRDQQVNYEPFDPFPAETHELALDKLTMITQEPTQISASPDDNFVVPGNWLFTGNANIQDGIGGIRKIGYRNPFFRRIGSAYEIQQIDEGVIFIMWITNVVLDLPELEGYTRFWIKTLAAGTNVRLRAVENLTLTSLEGGVSQEVTGGGSPNEFLLRTSASYDVYFESPQQAYISGDTVTAQ